MDIPKSSSPFDMQNAILEPNAEYTFHYDDFELVIKPNKFTAIAFSSQAPQFHLHPIDKFPKSWTKTN